MGGDGGWGMGDGMGWAEVGWAEVGWAGLGWVVGNEDEVAAV